MLNGFDASLEERLKMAEQAEQEVTRLQPLAAEAPSLRAERARSQRQAQRDRTRGAAMEQAKRAAEAASQNQTKVPLLLGTAARAVSELFSALRDIDSHRQAAMKALAVADRVDYEIEVEEGEEHELSLDRDPRGLAYALAGRHGDSRVKLLLEELTPGFSPLTGCNLDDPLYREVADFAMTRAVQTPKPTPPPAQAPIPTPASEVATAAQE
ncbi:MAG: hypothetical protein QF659_06925 [Dehalococcoidia bacterium]|jgi:hypothetical protein|nr:hypothetical protein [Dehalococcoidia bacterium]